MRLICGLIRLDGADAHASQVLAMADAQTAPGLSPAILSHVEGPAALAVLDFATSAPQAGTLPQGSDGTWLAADARLDQPGDLFAMLERFGPDLPDRLNGDFALAAWYPARRRLLCSRDFMGVRPLCYVHRPGKMFAFASLPKGLHGSGLVPLTLDPVALGRRLVDLSCRDDTGFAHIFWLPPGHSLIVEGETFRMQRAWTPNPDKVGCWRGTPEDAAETMRHLVEQAVSCRLPAVGPVACHLSGGLDSSAITVLAARAMRTRGQVHAFSLLAKSRQDMPFRDEREYVEAVLAQEPQILWSAVHIPPLDGPGLDDPDLSFDDAGILAEAEICAAAAATGATLLLSGAGGDEGATYNGADLYAALLCRGRWRALAAALRARAERDRRPLVRVVAERLIHPFVPAWLRALRRRLRHMPPPTDRRRMALEFLAPDLRRQVCAGLRRQMGGSNSARDRIHLFTDSYIHRRTERWSIAAARHGLAFSYPLLDRRIVDFALSLPLEHFLADGLSRQPFRRAMRGILPESIRWRDCKFSPAPDVPLNMALSRPGLLTAIHALRGTPAAQHLDLAAMAAAITAAPAIAEIRAQAPLQNNGGTASPQLIRAHLALRAFALAQRLARFGGKGSAEQ